MSEPVDRLVLAAGSVLDAAPFEVLEAAAAAGFDGIGLRLRPSPRDGVPAVDDRAGLHAIRDRAAGLGLEIHDVEVHRIGTDAPASLHDLLAATVHVGARRLLAVSDLADRAATVDALGEAVEAGASAGVEVSFEYMAWTTPSTPADARSIAAATGASVVVDLLHHHRVGVGPAELAALVEAGCVAWVQLADAPRRAPDTLDALVHEARHARLVPGEGELPLSALLDVVPADLTVAVEVQSDALAAAMGPHERVARLARASRAMLARAGRPGQRPSSTG